MVVLVLFWSYWSFCFEGYSQFVQVISFWSFSHFVLVVLLVLLIGLHALTCIGPVVSIVLHSRASFFTLKLCLSPKCVTDHNTKTTPGKLQVNPVKD